MAKKNASKQSRFWFFAYDACFDRGVLVGRGNTVKSARDFLKKHPGGWVRDLITHVNMISR